MQRFIFIIIICFTAISLFAENNDPKYKLKESSTADDYIAGILANEANGKLKKCEKWLKQGLKQFPGDYLLLYHGGRIRFANDNRIGEELLLQSIQANPSFAEAHQLLGESMFQKGDYLKAALPLCYFLFLENDSERSSKVSANLEKLFDIWSASPQGVIKLNSLKSGIECDFASTVFDKSQKDKSLKYNWLVNQMVMFLESMSSIKTASGQVLWEFYSDFFKNVFESENANAFANHLIYSRYPSDVLEWISGNVSEYQRMIEVVRRYE